MSAAPHAFGRRVAILAGLAAVTLLDHLSRKGRFAMSSALPDAGSQPPATTTPHDPGATAAPARRHGDASPGEPREVDVRASVRTYLIGLGLAALLTAGSFLISSTSLIYAPGVPVALIVFALAQVGVHLVFFLHLTTSPDNINNAMALAFGVLIVVLLVGGTLWIMMHMNQNMMPAGSLQRGHM